MYATCSLKLSLSLPLPSPSVPSLPPPLPTHDLQMLKHVERAIYTADLGLIPQTIPNGDEFLIRVPIPRPTAETRAALLKDVSRICENARVSIRSARHTGQKQLKSDVDNKVVGTSEAKKEGQQVSLIEPLY